MLNPNFYCRVSTIADADSSDVIHMDDVRASRSQERGNANASLALAPRHCQEATMAGGAKSKPQAVGKRQAVKSANARRREQAKRTEKADTTQQGNRANVRQNTTTQGHGRPK